MGRGWVFHLNNQFLGNKLPDRVSLTSCSIVTVEIPIVGPLSMHSFTYLLQYFHKASMIVWPCGMNSK
jgi:hypothetical protein